MSEKLALFAQDIRRVSLCKRSNSLSDNMTQAAARYPHDIKLGVRHLPAALEAFKIQQERARDNKQVWTDKHAHVMRELQQAYVLTGMGLSFGRKAWPLAVGTGKTQSIIALLKAQSEQLDQGKPALSVLVCVEQIKQMESLYSDALAAGVPEHLMGIYHVDSVLADAHERLFLFATHNRMTRGALSVAAVNTFKGNERNLVIWDESLIHSRPLALDIIEADVAVYQLGAEAVDDDTKDAAAYLGRYRDQLKATAAGKPSIDTLEELKPEDELRFDLAIKDTLSADKHKECREVLLTMLECCNRPSRILTYAVPGMKGKGVIRRGAVQYETLIPNSLRRLIILDASHTIRLLCSRHDPTVTTADIDCSIKRFDNVSVKHIKQGGGRTTMGKALKLGLKSPLVKALVEEIKSKPVGDSVLIVTFKETVKVKDTWRTHQELLKAILKSAGVDVDHSRFRFINWGQHIGSNDYRECKHAICAGILRRNPLEVAASVFAQEQNLESTSLDIEGTLAEVELSEAFHNLMQFAGRGNCRHTTNGQAHEMSLTFVYPDDIPASMWEQSMPGVQLVKEGRKGKLLAPVQAILKTLEAWPTDQQYIRSTTLKLAAGLGAMDSGKYSKLMRKAAQQVKTWVYSKDRRGFVRASPFGDVSLVA